MFSDLYRMVENSPKAPLWEWLVIVALMLCIVFYLAWRVWRSYWRWPR